jgi:sulfite reductase (NADPH) flavoprotein alpha-component
VAWDGDDAAIIVRISHGSERGTDSIAFDPYTGSAIGQLRGIDFFETVEQWHRNLAAGPVGKQIVGASTALLIVLAISGLVLRWPRRPLSARAWLTMKLTLHGRPLMWHLHAVGATWLLLFYLVAATTGLWWSYDVYRNAINRIAGATSQVRRPAANDARSDIARFALDAAWTTFRRQVRDASHAMVSTAAESGAPIEIRYRTPASAHSRAWNTFKVDADGERIADEKYTEQTAGRRFVASIFPLHSGEFFGWPGRIGMAIAGFALPLFFVTGIVMWMQRRAIAARHVASERVRVRTPAAPIGDA